MKRDPNRFEAMTRALAGKPHGTRLRYRSGCRCMVCRAANSRYETERLAARKRGEGNGIVSAARARRHILGLADDGVGYKTVADAAGVAASIVALIRSGKRKRIRAQTLRRILAVDVDAMADHALVYAGPTLRRIEDLVANGGFTKMEIAKRLGYKSPALQVKGPLITRRMEAKIERFHYRYMVEDRQDRSLTVAAQAAADQGGVAG